MGNYYSHEYGKSKRRPNKDSSGLWDDSPITIQVAFVRHPTKLLPGSRMVLNVRAGQAHAELAKMPGWCFERPENHT